jgi:hypothetical protein
MRGLNEMAVPVLLYVSENSAMNTADRRIIETAEMNLLGYVSANNLKEQVNNKDIRQKQSRIQS